MFKTLRLFLRPGSSFVLNPLDLLKDQPSRRFWRSYKKGSTVSVSVSDYAGAKLNILFQRPIVKSDVKKGKLVPSSWLDVKRRGGKRQTGLILSLECAEALHTVLGRALKEAKAKQHRKLLKVRLFNFLASYVAIQKSASTGK